MLTTPLRPSSDDSDVAVVSPAGRCLSMHTGAMRRRRVSYALLGAFALSVLLGIAGYRVGWWVALSVAILASAYRVVLAQVRRKSARQEWDLPVASDVTAWDGFYGGLVDHTAAHANPAEVRQTMGPWALARFAVGYLAAWMLTPIVALAEQMAGGARADSRRRLWLERLRCMQRYGRQQSVTALKVSMVATAGVGSFAALGLSASTASAASLISSAATTTHYTVVVGDTLGSIAQRFGTTVSALASTNGISDPNLIFVGQELVIGGSGSGLTPGPASAGGTAARSGSQTYTVQAGDTLGAIAVRFGTTVSVLASTNGIANPNLIMVGQVLVVNGGAAPAAAPTTTPSAAPSTPITTAAPSTSSAAATAVRVALAQVGKPYMWAGAGPGSFDCSGLVMYAYAAAGISLPHYTVSQFDDTTPISEAQLEPGDLVFYDTGDGAQPGHVTMYIGNGQVVSANSPGTDVQTQSVGYDGTIMGFRRVVN